MGENIKRKRKEQNSLMREIFKKKAPPANVSKEAALYFKKKKRVATDVYNTAELPDMLFMLEKHLTYKSWWCDD